jgi:hypothetical protein
MHDVKHSACHFVGMSLWGVRLKIGFRRSGSAARIDRAASHSGRRERPLLTVRTPLKQRASPTRARSSAGSKRLA